MTMKDVTYEHHPFTELFPPLTRAELEGLAGNIKEKGLDDPVWIYEGKILDGRGRAEACKRSGIELKTREFAGSAAEALALVWSANFHRRHMDSGQLAAVAEIFQRQYSSKKDLWELIPTQAVDRNRKTSKLAKMFGTNRKYVEACSKCTDEELREVRDGKVRMIDRVREQNRQRNRDELNSIASRKIREAEGKFDVINIDPPWPMEKILEFKDDSNAVGWPYPVMSLEAIQALEIPAAENCHVFLWVPAKFVHDAFHLLEGWGLKYTDMFVWKKTTKKGCRRGMQMANHAGHNCEFVLHARKGNPRFDDQKNFCSCFDGVLIEHSAKPREWYELLRRVTSGRRLDMFNRRGIEGFESMGNEACTYRERLTIPRERVRLVTPMERERLGVVV